MKNERGAVKIITIVEILLIIIVILFGVVIWLKTSNQEKENTIANQNAVTSNEVAENTTTTQTVQNVDNNTFDFSFLKMENEEKNMLYSPLSIKYALKMLQEGAGGNTLSQIEKVTNNVSLTKYQNIGRNLSLANGLFIKDTFYSKVKPEYSSLLASQYNAEIIQDKFENANNINKWIDNKTLGIIKKMLEDNNVEGAEMILVNALAIDMEWKEQFSDNSTFGKPFYLKDETEIQATTMTKETSESNTSYYKNEKITALTMDLKQYDNTKFEFVAIMPDKDLKQYVDNFSLDKMNEIDKNLKSADKEKDGVIVNIPKFSFEYDLKLKEDLQNLGITDAFSRGLANLEKMTTSEEKLYVKDALHKANIDFTEKGVKAAAVTAFVMATGMALPVEEKHPVEININKPFMFLIRDKNTKEVWFTGTVYEPNKWEDDRAEYEKGY